MRQTQILETFRSFPLECIVRSLPARRLNVCAYNLTGTDQDSRSVFWRPTGSTFYPNRLNLLLGLPKWSWQRAPPEQDACSNWHKDVSHHTRLSPRHSPSLRRTYLRQQIWLFVLFIDLLLLGILWTHDQKGTTTCRSSLISCGCKIGLGFAWEKLRKHLLHNGCHAAVSYAHYGTWLTKSKNYVNPNWKKKIDWCLDLLHDVPRNKRHWAYPSV